MMKLAMSDEPPWLMKGSVMPVSGNEARDAADDDEGLQHDDGGEAHGGERADVGFRPGRCDDAADGEAQIQQQHTGRAEQARLLGDDREDEVALGDGDAALVLRARPPMPRPIPVPNRSPSAMEYKLCTSWKPPPWASAKGSCQMATRVCTWPIMP